MERLLDDLSFEAPDRMEKECTVNAEYVRNKLSAIEENEDLSRYILIKKDKGSRSQGSEGSSKKPEP